MNCWDASQLTADHAVAADFVVVGSGAGGAVAAAVLARAGLRVVLIEEGGYYTGADLDGNPQRSMNILYRQRGLTGTLGFPPIPVPLGRCVGGTTTVNSGTCFRTPGFILHKWERDLGLEGATRLEEDYGAVETDLGIKPVPDSLYGPQNGRVEQAVVHLGWKGSRIARNEKGCLATGVCPFGCPSDGKMAMSVAKVPEALEHGAELWTRARAYRLLRRGKTVTGVVARAVSQTGYETGPSLTIHASVTVLACGAMHTPALLLSNGIRNAWVGRNLHLHPATRVVARFPEIIDGWREVPQAYNIDQFIEEGIFIQGQFVPPELQAPLLPGFGHAHKSRMAAFRRLASFGVLISDDSCGRVRNLPGSIEPIAFYQLQKGDLRKLLSGIARTAEVFFAAGAEEVYSGVAACPVLKSQKEAESLEQSAVPASQIEIMAFHPMGTVRAGASRLAACDPWGRLHGYQGIAVADASLLPTSNRINPQLTIMALARRAARCWIGA